MVRLSELVQPEFVHLGVEAQTKEELMERLVDSLVAQGRVEDRSSVLSSLVERERVMSTGIGRGVAIPHAQSGGAKALTVSIARPSQPLDFGSVDHEPVKLVFLVTGPEERGGFIRVLARISRLLCSSGLQERVLGATDPDAVVAALTEEEDALG
ncbi:MAG: PTS sugar transporter subunit IIA [Candidatus Eisenbacteria bacterium]|uniref:PTS sugar transporter subunit IIA n=1 Tax=Eiseniibacteriota bacterium TaxID=2212470 RepID=A0A956NBD0_UNCEI|nr:PTS sugar transporter subunit IIA [Candidatus Eisenbacteria bacterium]MCB9463136.1 PTS sugar transporter subunit IIA [Candidatus Eisenbacteria bacterium]